LLSVINIHLIFIAVVVVKIFPQSDSRESLKGKELSLFENSSSYSIPNSVNANAIESFSDPELLYKWRIVNRDNGIQTWVQSDLKYKSAPYSMACRFESPTLQNDDWLISPKVQVAIGDSLTFWHSIQSGFFPESLYVKIGTTNNPNSGTWTNLAVIFDNSTSWKYKKYSLSSYAGQQIYIAFVNRSRDAFTLYIDDVSLPQIIAPSNDLALVKFYQSSGLPPESDFPNHSVNKSFLSVDHSGIPAKESDALNTLLLKENKSEDLPIELNNIYIRSAVRNFGRTSTTYSLNWTVNGFTQTPFNAGLISPDKRDSFVVVYQPPSRGTFLAQGNLVLSGDENLHNNSQNFRLRVYPNSYSRTIYDRGDNFPDTYMGYGNPSIRFKAGVRFTAPENIKLAGVDFVYQTEYVTSGQIEIQIRSAGTTINSPGLVLYSKTYNSSVYLTGSGDIIHFAFDDNAPTIAAGSDYWITIKLPSGIYYPCAVHNNGFVSTHSYYQGSTDTTIWYPLVINSTERSWIMRSVHIPAISSFQFTTYIFNGWNLVSVPGAHPNNQHINTWWQYRDQSASVFGFDKTYYQASDVSTGKGYWMKHSGNRIYNTGDEWPASGILYSPHQPVQCNSGWNLISAYEIAVPVSALSTAPPNIIVGLVYGFTPGSAYQAASTLVPGYGYWAKCSAYGQINFPSTISKVFDENTNYLKNEWAKIIITDNQNKSSTLYLTDDKIDFDFFELPPVPFSDLFDVRFSSNRFVESLSGKKEILLQGVEYPVRIKIHKCSVDLMDEYGKLLSEKLNSDSEVEIDNPAVKKIIISSDEELPFEFSLEQNYPNPFNATTKIRYTIPASSINPFSKGEGSFVVLKVFDVLGNEVATLVNEFLDAGRYEAQFNASELSSGIYYYKLKYGNQSIIKKMILLK
jgi:hypothetical protein